MKRVCRVCNWLLVGRPQRIAEHLRVEHPGSVSELAPRLCGPVPSKRAKRRAPSEARILDRLTVPA